jgi:hypothetical protein
MKSQDEIQRAHDMLVAIILGEVPNPFPADALPFLQANCDVLCWLLGCEHNKTFAENLDNAEAALSSAGYWMFRKNN